MKIGILGFGEVGKAIARFYTAPLVADLSQSLTFSDDVDMLHICIPFSDSFQNSVVDWIKKTHARYVVIHSTVPVGTTKLINTACADFYKFRGVVHSPVRGVHPDLFPALNTFEKYVGCDDLSIGRVVCRHFSFIGIKSTLIKNSGQTELGKLLSTTYYGLCIAFHDYANRLCSENGFDFSVVLTDFNKTYNAGFSALGREEVCRPVLFPPCGPIGGHCIVPNAKILSDQFGYDSLLDLIINLK